MHYRDVLSTRALRDRLGQQPRISRLDRDIGRWSTDRSLLTPHDTHNTLFVRVKKSLIARPWMSEMLCFIDRSIILWHILCEEFFVWSSREENCARDCLITIEDLIKIGIFVFQSRNMRMLINQIVESSNLNHDESHFYLIPKRQFKNFKISRKIISLKKEKRRNVYIHIHKKHKPIKPSNPSLNGTTNVPHSLKQKTPRF